jgi:glutathione synthase/RimK-type ligase-like ATP-grasp enzyme
VGLPGHDGAGVYEFAYACLIRFALCSYRPDNAVVSHVAHECRRRNHEPVAIASSADLDRAGHVHFDAGAWRPNTRRPARARDARRAVLTLEGRGVPFVNSLMSVARSRDKLVSAALFRAAGLPTPETVLLPDPRSGLADLPSGPKVVKPVRGTRARGISVAGERGEVLDLLDAQRDEILVQPAIDWETYYRVVATPTRAIRVDAHRRADGGLVRRFDAATARPVHQLSPDLDRIGRAMVGAVGGRMMGADVLEDRDGRLWALEVNAHPGLDPSDQVMIRAIVDVLERTARG